jgi:two-component system OmpR family sensor kinase
VKAPDRLVSFAPPAPVAVTGDDHRLRQVVDNLLTNAVNHTPPGTPIEVAVGVDGTDALLSVVDHGPGIGPDDIGHIFEPFHRADPSRARATGGVGLGLAIVSAIAAAHGGSVGVESVPGAGARFWVRLPLVPAPALPPLGSDSPELSGPPMAPPVPAPPPEGPPVTGAPPPVPTMGGDPA